MRKSVFLLMLVFLFSSVDSAFSYWIWTPKTGKFVNPKTAVKSTPKEQFDFAKSLYESKSYEEAKREFKKLIKRYPKSFEASEAQYYLGLIEQDKNNLYEAYKAFQKVIDKYPFSERIAEIIEREYNIAESFMSGKTRRKFGASFPVEDPAIEIFQKVIENSAFGPYAVKAQYKLGLVFKGMGNYYEAEEAFRKVVANYPQSELVEAAKFQIASCKASMSKSPDYDQVVTKEAKDKFQEFIEEHPDAALSREAEKYVEELEKKEAESNYSIGRFYEKQKEYKAARIYYEETIKNSPDSPWAQKAGERLKIMGEK